MNCPHCTSTATTTRGRRTVLGYRRFSCRSCQRYFTERTGTPFNELHSPTDLGLLAVLWRLHYKLSFRDVAEMLLQRGYEVTHETIREWEIPDTLQGAQRVQRHHAAARLLGAGQQRVNLLFQFLWGAKTVSAPG